MIFRVQFKLNNSISMRLAPDGRSAFCVLMVKIINVDALLKCDIVDVYEFNPLEVL